MLSGALHITKAFLAGQRTPERLEKMLRKLRLYANNETANLDAAVQQGSPTPNQPLPIACKAGCAHCCHQRVFATIPELLVIANHVRTTFAPEEREALKDRLATYSRGRSAYDESKPDSDRQACPFLIDNNCSIYDVRPFVCQRYHSMDLEACVQLRFEPEKRRSVPSYEHRQQLIQHIMRGSRRAFVEEGLAGDYYELGTGAAAAIDHPEAFEEYFQGSVETFSEVTSVTPKLE